MKTTEEILIELDRRIEFNKYQAKEMDSVGALDYESAQWLDSEQIIFKSLIDWINE
jgi:hypothetical protein